MNKTRRIQGVLCLFMKISLTQLLLITAFATLASAADTNGQEILERKVSISVLDTDVSSVLRQIEEQLSVAFSYRTKTIKDAGRVTLQVKDAALGVVLKQLFDDDVVINVRENREILLKPRLPKDEDVVSFQTDRSVLTVTGVVLDESDMSLPGVNVIEKGTTNGTTTDASGHFTLSVKNAHSILVFSFIGYKSQEVTVGTQTQLSIKLEPAIEALEEVVVVGYGEQKKATVTGSVGSIDSENLTQRPAANTADLLQGQVAGLITRQSTGLPGADGPTINIRGFGAPMIIVDGVQGGLDNIDPNDIESISVLKDAAASVYGARAGNGVILVTTKRGTDKPAEITYNGSVSFSQPTFTPKLVGARQWAELLHESGLNPDNYSPNHVSYDPATKTLTNTLDGSDFEGYNWGDIIYRDWTPMHQHNLSARGGNKNMAYFISAGFTDQESNFKSGDFDFSRYNLRSNVDANVTEHLKVSLDLTYRTMLIDQANFGIFNVYNALNKAKPVYPYIHEADPTRATYSGFSRTPYHAMFKEYSGTIEDRNNQLQGRVGLQYSFPMIKGLSANASLSFTDSYAWNKTVSKPYTMWEYDAVAANGGQDPWIERGVVNLNEMFVSSSRTNVLLPILSLQYENTFGNHYVKGIVLSETWTRKHTTLRGDRKNILSFEAPYLDYASEEGKDNAESLSQGARSSIVSRINYDYAGKYLLEVAMRADASAEYAPQGRWGYFPSVSAGWRISEESFFRDKIGNVNNLKLRASYGVLGNDAVSSFDYLTGYNITGGYYIFENLPAPIINTAGLANPNITWETMKISNIGLDGVLWNGKLGFNIDVFYRLKEGILAEPATQVPNTFGAALPKTNLNVTDNRGFELALSHANKIGQFAFDVSPMISWSRGKYVEWDESVLPVTGDIDEETREYNRLWNAKNVKEGQWDDRVWGFVSDGFFRNQQEIDDYVVNQDQNGNKTLKVGDIRYKDLNGDDYIDWRDQRVIGKGGLPNIMYSMNMGASYKGLSVRMLWQGASDYQVTMHGPAASPFSNESIPLDVHYKYRAILGVDDEGNEFVTNPETAKLPPVSQNGNTGNNAKESDFWTYDARFIRLKTLNVSYSLPQALTLKGGVKKCTFYMSATNLLTFSNLGIWKHSFDPEIISQNNSSYPPVKSLTLGLRLTLK